METQIKKGILEMCVLFAIRDGEMYGYDLMKHMKNYFPNVSESTFYAILRRLHADGSAQVTLGGQSGGPPRKYYAITDAGRESLGRAIKSWEQIRDSVGKMGIGL